MRRRTVLLQATHPLLLPTHHLQHLPIQVQLILQQQRLPILQLLATLLMAVVLLLLQPILQLEDILLHLGRMVRLLLLLVDMRLRVVTRLSNLNTLLGAISLRLLDIILRLGTDA